MNMEQMIDAVEAVAVAVGGEVRKDYSGRGMFGVTCFGVVCRNAERAIEEAAERGIKGARVDSMGRDEIVYWPSIFKQI